MINEIVVAVRLVEATAVAIKVIEAVDTAVCAIPGGLGANGVGGAFTPRGIITKICKGDVSGIASPNVVDDAGKDIDSPSVDCVCVGYTCGLEEEASGEHVPKSRSKKNLNYTCAAEREL